MIPGPVAKIDLVAGPVLGASSQNARFKNAYRVFVVTTTAYRRIHHEPAGGFEFLGIVCTIR